MFVGERKLFGHISGAPYLSYECCRARSTRFGIKFTYTSKRHTLTKCKYAENIDFPRQKGSRIHLCGFVFALNLKRIMGGVEGTPSEGDILAEEIRASFEWLPHNNIIIFSETPFVHFTDPYGKEDSEYVMECRRVVVDAVLPDVWKKCTVMQNIYIIKKPLFE
jgi:hypothetical protein